MTLMNLSRSGREHGMAVPHYDRIELASAGLAPNAAADMSAGRAVFLPWAKPRRRTSLFGAGAEGACAAPAQTQTEPRFGPLPERAVFVASGRSAGVPGLLGWLRGEGASVGFDSDLGRALATVAAHPADWAALVVQADGFGDIEDLVDMLLAFRCAHPSVPVILISSTFGRDTLGTERLALCDVSLRHPVSLGRIGAVLDQAVVQNLAWQRRLKALAPRAPAASPPVQPVQPVPTPRITPRRVVRADLR